jgi:hypothetical protein
MFREGGELQFGPDKDTLTPQMSTTFGLWRGPSVRVGHDPADASAADDHYQMYPLRPFASAGAWHGTARTSTHPLPSFIPGAF